MIFNIIMPLEKHVCKQVEFRIFLATARMNAYNSLLMLLENTHTFVCTAIKVKTQLTCSNVNVKG